VKVSVVVAMDENRVIGADNRLPWHLPADLRHFKSLTMGHPLLMGRRTHESIGRPLPGRRNLVLTHRSGYRARGCTVVHDLDAAREAAGFEAELMVIGGAEVFRQLLPEAGTIHLTRIHHVFDGDTYFPELAPREWREVARQEHAPDAANRYAYSFIRLERA
jgi:dihydrofolate reductase